MVPRRCTPTLALLLLAGCGGGIGLGWGDGWGDGPPSVSVVLPAGPVRAGDTIVARAAAADGDGIDEVAFYRLDGSTAVRLGADGASPYEWTLVVPSDGRTTLTVFARATDGWGDRADSARVSVDVLP